MTLKELKDLAKSNGLDFAKNANMNQMKELLIASGIDFVVGETEPENHEMFEEKKPIKINNYHDLEVEELIKEYKYAESAIDLKKADQKRFILKGKIKDNAELTLKVLKWERMRKIIGVADNYKLNELEKDECSKSCACIRTINSGGSFAEVGKEYPYLSYFDEGRGKEVFVIYVDRTIEPEAQISKELAWMMSQGFMPKMEDYAPAKTLWHRVAYVESEFVKYFSIEE